MPCIVVMIELDITAMHLQVRHSLRGDHVLRRFLFQISNISPDWKIENVLEEELEKIRRIVSNASPIPYIVSRHTGPVVPSSVAREGQCNACDHIKQN